MVGDLRAERPEERRGAAFVRSGRRIELQHRHAQLFGAHARREERAHGEERDGACGLVRTHADSVQCSAGRRQRRRRATGRGQSDAALGVVGAAIQDCAGIPRTLTTRGSKELRMIRLDNVAKHFGGRTLFDGVQWAVAPRARVGLVGPNGAGKSTIFRLMTGEMQADEGAVIRPKGCTIGILPQDVGELGDVPCVQYVLSGREELQARAEAMERLTAELDAATDDAEAARIGSELAERVRRVTRAARWLQRTGGEAEAMLSSAWDFRASVAGGAAYEDAPANDRFSGGWRMRLVLSRLLLQRRSSVLLMDEPTNHLDVPSVEWLEGFLRDYEGAVIVISHDRYFLNRLVTQIAAMEPQGLHLQEGNYDAYIAGWDERAEQLEKMKARQDREIKELERFVERFKAKATKAKQAQSRVKRLAKIERVETLSSKAKMRGFRFAEAQRSGKVVCQLEGVAKSYGENVVYESLDLTLYGQRVAVVGPNGAGKSTMLKILAGRLDVERGGVELGHNVQLAFFGQHQVELLDPKKTLLEEMESSAPYDEVPRCRGILGAFLFTGDDVKKKVSVLSGGERNRLALAKLLLRPTNLLLLDEPTNHLDIDSRDVLIEALRSYEGTLAVVSHDRHFINEVADRIVHVESRQTPEYDGDYEYYASKQREAAAAEQATAAVSAPAPKSKRDKKRRDAARREDKRKKLGSRKKDAAAIEERIAHRESAIFALEAALAAPSLYESGDAERIAQLTRDLQAEQAALESDYEAWSGLTEEIERIEAEFTT